MFDRLWKSALAFVMGIILAGSALAAPVPTEPKAGDNAVQKARKALEQKITAKSDGKTVFEAIELLKEVGKIDIALDTPTIQMLGIDFTQQIVKFDYKDIKLKDCLRTAFSGFSLRCGVTSTGIIVSTDEGVTIRQLRQLVTIDVESKSLAEALKSLADETGANIVIDPRAKKMAEEKMTLKIEDVPLESAVRLAADVGGLAVVRMSNVLFVTTEARADKLRPDADRPVGPAPGGFGVDGGFGGGGGPFAPQVAPAFPPRAEDPPPAKKK